MLKIITYIKQYPKLISIICAYSFLGIGSQIVTAKDVPDLQPSVTSVTVVAISNVSFKKTHVEERVVTEKSLPIFKHGDISWLPKLATEAGWPEDTWKKLGQIILRESGGCPVRFGGSIVDKNCNLVGHDGSDHRSDSGLLQINGVHWKKDHPQYAGLVCKKMKICTQEPLFDAVTNLKAGKLIYDVTGNWAPWDPCYWGPKFAKRCAAMSK